ncbi:MAG: alkaline phosphatase [Chloroflexia bacterium]|nr:alkaline phosphatase [Chloroflexia bacterium]
MNQAAHQTTEPLPSTNGRATPARNAIILIGDGMGAAHRFAGQLLLAGRYGLLTMDRLPVVGQMATLSADPASFVTDSAAAATAISTGVKTVNGAVSIDPAGRPRTTLLELAKRAGKAVGLVTTCQVTDATPAAFGAHVNHRSDQSEVARQYLHGSGVDVVLGGGAAWWLPAGTPDPFGSGDPLLRGRGTAGDLIAAAARLGYRPVADADGLAAAVNDPRSERVLGLFAAQEMFEQAAEGDGGSYAPTVTLAEMTGAAIEILSRNPEGFFLMVEESAIDRMAHRNNAPLTLKGVLELDLAVQVALAYAERDPETLVVVTADHETGGLAVAGSADTPYPYEPGGGFLDTLLAGEDGPFPVVDEPFGFVVGWATTGHTAATVPLTAAGPGADALAGFYENTHVFEVVAESLGLLSHHLPERRTGRATG